MPTYEVNSVFLSAARGCHPIAVRVCLETFSAEIALSCPWKVSSPRTPGLAGLVPEADTSDAAVVKNLMVFALKLDIGSASLSRSGLDSTNCN